MSVGALLGVVGLLLAVGGGIAAFFVIGPDDTVQSDEQHLVSKGLAIASTPGLLELHGPILHVEARSAKPVFIGVARDFDVASYLKDVAHTSLVQLTYPIALNTQEQKGATDPLTAPDSLDWWVAKGNGSLTWPIADGPHDVVIMSADGKTVPDVQVRLGIEIPNAFLIALAIFVGGLLILALGIVLIVARRRPAPVVPQPPTPAPFGTTYRVVAGTAVLGLLAGCSAIPERDTVTTLTRPAVTNESGAAVIKRYNEVSTAAGRARNEVQIGQVEGGELVKQTRAAYAIGRNLKRPLPKPAPISKPTFAVPEYGGYPMRFVSTAGSTVGLWQRDSAGGPWLQTLAATLQKSAKLPDLSGLRPLTTADKNFAVAPLTAPAALSEYLTKEGKSPHGASFAVIPEFATGFKRLAYERQYWHKHDPKSVQKVTRTYSAAAPPSAFVTKDGEAVVLATLRDEYLLVVGQDPDTYFYWSSGEANAFSLPSARYKSALKSTTLHDVALVIPPKGKGKIRILSYESQMVAAGGY
ncbi:hypothetical protein ACFTSF_08360 [Kribbella sp. NPDC056951]|uniref:hypothetical protein n=1 Tax=Kribbella sp. NPDC056951 TaxID=3345978 RepID=UPI00363A3719